MIKQNKHIEIVRSVMPGLSSMSQPSADAILAVLENHYSKTGITIVNNLTDLEALIAKKPDLVFLGMKFIPTNAVLGFHDPDKIWLSQYLHEHGIASTGSGKKAHKLELEKPLAKQCVLNAGLATAPFYIARVGQQLKESEVRLAYPLFVKPTNRGGGTGIDSGSVVNNFTELKRQVDLVSSTLLSDSLIEQFLPGREFSTAILKDIDSAEYLVMPIEKIASLDERGQRIFSQQIKSADAVIDLPVTDNIIRDKLCSLAIDIFHALGARDYGRIDIRIDKNGVPQFLEANLIPSLIRGYGSFPKACEINMGLGHEQMLIRIVQLGLAHNTNNLAEVAEPLALAGSIMPSVKVAFEAA